MTIDPKEIERVRLWRNSQTTTGDMPTYRHLADIVVELWEERAEVIRESDVVCDSYAAENGRFWEEIERLRADLAAVRAERDESSRLYHELLYEVQQKRPGLSRHEAAKVIIQAYENQDNPPQQRDDHD